MAYNNYFPATYQPFYPQYPQQPPVQGMAQQPQQQMMTPPTIRAEIVQVGSRAEALNFPVGAGQTQMMIMRDDSAIFIKSAFANGQANLDEYIRKPPEPEKPAADYITREEFEQRISALQRKVVNDEPISVTRTTAATATAAESGTDASAGKG